jgi:hypothetical protein
MMGAMRPRSALVGALAIGTAWWVVEGCRSFGTDSGPPGDGGRPAAQDSGGAGSPGTIFCSPIRCQLPSVCCSLTGQTDDTCVEDAGDCNKIPGGNSADVKECDDRTDCAGDRLCCGAGADGLSLGWTRCVTPSQCLALSGREMCDLAHPDTCIGSMHCKPDPDLDQNYGTCQP